jgi:hypothetical protein
VKWSSTDGHCKSNYQCVDIGFVINWRGKEGKERMDSQRFVELDSDADPIVDFACRSTLMTAEWAKFQTMEVIN